jgi:hypothetical protein
MYQKGSDMNNHFRDVITKEMNRRMGPGHEKLKSFIIPKWSPGCRRISPGDGYLEALVQDNVEPVYSGIKRVTATGIVTEDGVEHKMDHLICATGFQVAFKPAFKVINAAGKTVNEDWNNGPNLYMGVSAPRFPNYFTIVGPGATWSNGTLLPSIETTIEYSVKMMMKMQAEHIKSIEVRQEALDELYAHLDEYHKATVWSEECRSWFKDGKVKNRIYLWPGSVRKAAGRWQTCTNILSRQFTSSSPSKILASKTTTSNTGTRTASPSSETATSRLPLHATWPALALTSGTRITTGRWTKGTQSCLIYGTIG